MKTKAVAFAGITAATTFIATGANADFTDVTWVIHAQGGGQTSYRFYANFDDPTDQVLAVSGNSSQTLIFSTDTVLINNGGAFAGAKQEDFAQFPITGADDSWVTIGASGFAGNDTDYSPTFLNAATQPGISQIHGSSWSDSNDGWFDADPGSAETGPVVLIAQFTVADVPGPGDAGNVSFTGNVDYQDGGGPLVFGSFSVSTPAPGALALLGLAGLAGTRRRRG
jgi:MYXO-CTERM domain-containing protein